MISSPVDDEFDGDSEDERDGGGGGDGGVEEGTVCCSSSGDSETESDSCSEDNSDVDSD